jgi:hypothetical protein
LEKGEGGSIAALVAQGHIRRLLERLVELRPEMVR